MVVHLPMATEILPPEEGEAEGCVQCQAGSKLVLFVTGKCHWGCSYCPLSENRRETPDMFANERRCSTWEEVIEEGRAMNATGTGITGGDPMLDLERSLDAIRELKAAFGPDHHIHLYTSIPIDAEVAGRLAEAGLDELRFHLLDLRTTNYVNSITAAAEAGITTGVELPCEPDKAEALEQVVRDLCDLPVAFLNLNELEITTGNQTNMDVRGFNLAGGLSAAAEGSAELGHTLKGLAHDIEAHYHLKFCTAHYKDAGQLRHRFKRRATVTMRPYEVLSEDDTLLFGAIPCPAEHADSDLADLREALGLAERWARWDATHQRLEFPLSAAEAIADEMEVPVMAVEVHPTHERLEVGVVHLNAHR